MADKVTSVEAAGLQGHLMAITTAGGGPVRVSVWIKAIYGAGYFGQMTLQNASFLFLMLFYTDVVRLASPLAGVALSLGRIVDAFTDPLMGQISDRTQSRFGRRRPYIMFGSFLWGFVFILIWLPSSLWPAAYKFAYLMMTDTLFALCITLVQTPYFALGAELSQDYEERNNIAAYRLGFMLVGNIAGGGLLALTGFFKEQLAGTHTGILAHLAGLLGAVAHPEWTAASLVLAVITTACMFFSGLVPRERFASRRTEKFNTWQALCATLSNTSYRRVVGTYVAVYGGTALTSFLIPFIMIYFVKKPAWIMPMYAVYALSGVASLPLWLKLGRRLEKSAVVRILCFCQALLCPLAFVFLRPANPHFVFIYVLMAGSCQAAFLTYSHSMVGDVTDEDELSTGQRREGMYFGVYTLLFKIMFSLGTLWSGFCLALIGYVPNAEQSARTLSWMQVLFALPFLVGLLGLLFLRGYSLDRSRLAQIHVQLSKRANM